MRRVGLRGPDVEAGMRGAVTAAHLNGIHGVYSL